MKEKKRGKGPGGGGRSPLGFVLLLLFPLYGGYYAFSFLLCGAVLSVLLWLRARREKHLTVPTDGAAWCLYGVCACHLLSIPFAVSAGMAWTGFLRTLVWALFYVCAAALSGEEKDGILDAAAYEGALLSLISGAAFAWTLLSGGVDPNGRIDGLFQYANTWALYQLACLILLGLKEKRRFIDWPAMALLAMGIFLTGSRGVILLTALMALFAGVWYSVRMKKLLPAAAALLLLLAGAAASLLSGGMVLDRIRRITLASSSLNGRLLYWRDGLAILRAHPLGVGSGGYRYVQAAVQTGVYTVRYIHNEYLQAALDGGLPAGALMLALAGFLLFRRGAPARERAVVFAVAVHSFMDFDLRFTAVMLLLLLCGRGDRRREISLRRKALLPAAAGLLLLCFAYFSLAYYLDYLGESMPSRSLFPADLELTENAMAEEASPEAAEALADGIVASTEYSMLAWDCKYRAAARRGDLREAAEAKYRYLLLNRYREAVWEDFTALLESASASDPAGREVYGEYARAAAEALERTVRETGPLALRIEEQPDFGFAEEITARLLALEKGNVN